MANITHELRTRIQSQLCDEYQTACMATAYKDIPPLPTALELSCLIRETPEYRATTKYEGLTIVSTILASAPELTEWKRIPVSPPIPVIKGKELNLGDWSLFECHNGMQIAPTKTSMRHTRAQSVQHDVQRYKGTVRKQLYQVSTVAQFVATFPEWAHLPCIIAAQVHEKEVRQNAAAARKNAAPLERVEVSTDSSVAIAKARLLGAKYVT